MEEVRKLLAQGADPNLKDNAGWTPLVSEENSHTIQYKNFTRPCLLFEVVWAENGWKAFPCLYSNVCYPSRTLHVRSTVLIDNVDFTIAFPCLW